MKEVQGIQVAHAVKPTFGFPTDKRPDPVYPDDYRTAAIVVWDDDLTETENLDRAFRLTNHIDRPWWENPDVTAAGPVPLKHRSTSVGDVLGLPNGKFYRVAALGWEEIHAAK